MVNRLPCICNEQLEFCECEELRTFRVHPKAIAVVAIFVVIFVLAMAITAARF